MKLSFLRKIVSEHAYRLKDNAAHSGSYTDGGCDNLLTRLSTYENKWVVKLNLRPSEFKKLNEIEVGEPEEFSQEIEKYKISLTKNIQL